MCSLSLHFFRYKSVISKLFKGFYIYLPDEIVSDFNEIQLSRKPRQRAFKRRKNRPKMIRSDDINGRRKIAYYFEFTIKLLREAPDFFYTIKLSLRPTGKKSYYQTFVRTRRKKTYYQTLPPKAVIFFFGPTFFEIRDLRIHI